MECGHSYMEVDSMHSATERAQKYVPVYTMQDWLTVFRMARTTSSKKKPFVVQELKYKDFLDLEGLSKLIKNKTRDMKNEKIHTGCFLWCSLYLLNYYTLQFKFHLKALNDKVVHLGELRNEHKDVFEVVRCVDCQQIYYEEMIYIIQKFVRIKNTLDYYNTFFKWRLLTLSTAGAAILAICLILIFSVKTKESLPYYGFFLSSLLYSVTAAENGEAIKSEAVRSKDSLIYYSFLITTLLGCYLVAESGEEIKSKSEMIFVNAQQLKWYYWNKKNRQMLMMFLLVTQKPLELNCHGFLVQSREMMLKVIKSWHRDLVFMLNSIKQIFLKSLFKNVVPASL
uniref:Uncharacterized protein LOC114330033 n=1 Tax=Diabrotica virgifera virgifera TaxID=50390 RepID=A0A6P7FGF5_DIAVI